MVTIMQHLTEEDLNRVVAALRETLDPVAVILYGSHAYGEPDEESDVDVLVIVEDREDASTHELAIQAYRTLHGMGIPVELKVDTVPQFEQLRTWVSSVEREAAERGRVLFHAPGRDAGLVA